MCGDCVGTSDRDWTFEEDGSCALPVKPAGHMVDAILRSLRHRYRRQSNSMAKQWNETKSVNLAIEHELAALNELEMKKEKEKKQQCLLIGSINSKKRGMYTAKSADELKHKANDVKVCEIEQIVDNVTDILYTTQHFVFSTFFYAMLTVVRCCRRVFDPTELNEECSAVRGFYVI
ncbi:hypothetical protein NECAME_05849 [Necator americanus]|uniref:Uncharacterized protein n=1 Tax=Necator americanus TaxID=51031 RepID=W2TYB8_NECAM|nr:hypothetical protein NECAME_05849 [Necator americanus]ETN86674.1 hypothetical protein NECAME_05849 [Necator americanus]